MKGYLHVCGDGRAMKGYLHLGGDGRAMKGYLLVGGDGAIVVPRGESDTGVARYFSGRCESKGDVSPQQHSRR